MRCEVITVKTIQGRQYATVKAGDMVGELPVSVGLEFTEREIGKIVPKLGVFNGRFQAKLTLQK